jgi:hypothetical protein
VNPAHPSGSKKQRRGAGTIARAVNMKALAPYAQRSRQGVHLSAPQSGEHPI